MQRPQSPGHLAGPIPHRLTPARGAYTVGALRPSGPGAPPPLRGRLPLLLLSEPQSVPPMFAERVRAVEIRRVRALPPAESLDPTRPTVVLLDQWLLAAPDSRVRAGGLARVAALVAVGEHGEREPTVDCPEELLTGYISGDAPARATRAQLRGAFRAAAALAAAHLARESERERQRELADLSRVAAALTIERDLMTLLAMILSQARRMTGSDAGSLYLVERDADHSAPVALRFKLAQNESLPGISLAEFSVPVDDTSLAGHAARTGQPLVIDDAADLPDGAGYRVNRSFDERFGYRTKSMLVIPMRSHRDEIVGVLQLINRKRSVDTRLSSPDAFEREVISYDERSVESATPTDVSSASSR